jgi:hypothetical protein
MGSLGDQALPFRWGTLSRQRKFNEKRGECHRDKHHIFEIVRLREGKSRRVKQIKSRYLETASGVRDQFFSTVRFLRDSVSSCESPAVLKMAQSVSWFFLDHRQDAYATSLRHLRAARSLHLRVTLHDGFLDLFSVFSVHSVVEVSRIQ